jgi:lactoylglutathione lyase
MKVAHIALWTRDLDRAAAFWQRTFHAEVGPQYLSKRNAGFRSRFVTLPEGPALELMTLPGLSDAASANAARPAHGWAHVAISLGSEEAVRAMADDMASQAALVSAPRWTGDGFYEAVIADPDGNLIEVTI